jgi:hypothetical protein
LGLRVNLKRWRKQRANIKRLIDYIEERIEEDLIPYKADKDDPPI